MVSDYVDELGGYLHHDDRRPGVLKFNEMVTGSVTDSIWAI